MNPPQPNEGRTCPFCGATLREKANFCWLCHLALQAVVPAGTEPPAPFEGRVRAPIAARGKPSVIFERRAAYQFSLASLMLIVTLFAVLLGIFRMAPGLGIVLFIVSAPALIRTYMVTYRRKKKGASVSPIEKTKMYLGSVVVGLIVLTVVTLAAVAAFFAACFGGFAISDDVEFALLAAVLAALVATGLVSWPIVLWVRRRWRKAVGEKNDSGMVDPP